MMPPDAPRRREAGSSSCDVDRINLAQMAVVALAVVAMEVAMVVMKASVAMAMVAEVQVAVEAAVAVGVVIRRRASPSDAIRRDHVPTSPLDRWNRFVRPIAFQKAIGRTVTP